MSRQVNGRQSPRSHRGRIAPKRKLVQWLTTLLLLAIPFIRVGGASLLRLDAESRTLYFFGASLRIVEFYLFLLVLLIFVFAFLLITMLFGRVWCGWTCPQTTLCDLADGIDRRISVLVRHKKVAAVIRQLSYLLLSALVASNLLWYFIPPPQFAARLLSGELGTVAGTTLTLAFLLVYLDLSLVRRSWCRSVCPYGRIQMMATERGTLTLEFDPALKGSCLQCGACLRACPMGIDIRKGSQIECINCGRCLDACRQVMERRNGNGLIRYRFGSDEGLTANSRSLALGAIIAVLAVLLAVGIATRKEASLTVQRAANGEVIRLPDGSLVNFYTVYLENRSAAAGTFTLQMAPSPGFRMELLGPVRNLTLPPNANRKIELALKITPVPSTDRKLELRLVKENRTVTHATLPLLTQ